MTAITGKTIWITGAGTGIGKELSLKLAQADNFVIVSGRRIEPLQALVDQYPENIRALPVDVSDDQARSSVSAAIREITDFLDIVVMGAGAVAYEDKLDFNADDYQRVFGANYFGLVNTLAVAMPLLARSQKKAYIVGLSSLSMMIGFPRAEAYGASKAAADYFLHSLSIDLPKRKYDVSIVRPGFVSTPLTAKNDFPMPFLMSADEAACRILKGMEKRKRLIVFPKRLGFLLKVLSWFPALWYGCIGPKTSRTKL